MNDPIVEEVRKARDQYAASFNYDLEAMVRDLREKQNRSGRPVARYGPAAERATEEEVKPLTPPVTDSAAPHSSAAS